MAKDIVILLHTRPAPCPFRYADKDYGFAFRADYILHPKKS